ncbi:MAG: PAS domain S-box protein [Pseudohongiellaceae bacterium]
MTSEIAYFLVAIGFILILNLMAFLSLRINFLSSRKPYLLLGCFAVGFEASRQVPALVLSLNPESLPAVLVMFGLGFVASLTLLWSIITREQTPQRNHKQLLGILVSLYLLGLVGTLVNGFPPSTRYWLPLVLPSILTSAAILVTLARANIPTLSGKIFLILSATSLLSIRIGQLMVESTEMVFLLYYMEAVIFPILISTLIFAEVEFTHTQLVSLLNERTRSEADLRFMLDNSVDIMLRVNKSGLLMSWNKRAEQVFGHGANQVIGKLHIDELFPSNYYHSNVDQPLFFDGTMERIDGKIFPVKIRMKTLKQEDEVHSIYVINEGDVEL